MLVKAPLDSNAPPWFEPRPSIEHVLLRLHEELLDFGAFMEHSQEEVEARRNWVRTIGAACRALWPECQVLEHLGLCDCIVAEFSFFVEVCLWGSVHVETEMFKS